MEKIRVLIVEDHNIVREGLKLLVNSQEDLEVVAEVGDGQAAVREALSRNPDVVVMDLSMPKLNGFQATRQILEATPAMRIIALSVHEDLAYVRDLLSAGVAGYVLKRAVAEDLLRAIRMAMNEGSVFLDHHLAQKAVNGYFDPQGQADLPNDQSLSGREKEVIGLIAFGYSNKEIAARLEISPKSVETYKARAMEKLGLTSRVDLVRFALEQGWLSDRE
jgi:DNA-binding NarL/FixJ family response regulator